MVSVLRRSIREGGGDDGKITVGGDVGVRVRVG